MTPAEKSLEAVNDLVDIVNATSVSGKDAYRVANCLAYLACVKAELQKDVLTQSCAQPEATSDQAAA